MKTQHTFQDTTEKSYAIFWGSDYISNIALGYVATQLTQPTGTATSLLMTGVAGNVPTFLTPHKNMPSIYLTAQHSFLVPAGADLRPALKAQGIDGRRMTRFTQLALLGAAPLAGEHLYLASSFHSPATFLRTFDNLLAHNLPSPLDFIANLHNAAAFHVAKYLNIRGTSLFVAVDGDTLWQPLWLAVNECLARPRDRVLVGWAWEAPPGSDAPEEGSIWWCISAMEEGAVASMAPEAASVAAPPAPADGVSMLQMVAAVHAQLQAGVRLSACGAPGFALQLQGI